MLGECLIITYVMDLGTKVRSYNCLKRVGISTIGDLCDKVNGREDLKRIRNCGKTSTEEIMTHLFAYQYSVLKPEKRVEYITRVNDMNAKG